MSQVKKRNNTVCGISDANGFEPLPVVELEKQFSQVNI
jgi:hypothetical protein